MSIKIINYFLSYYLYKFKSFFILSAYVFLPLFLIITGMGWLGLYELDFSSVENFFLNLIYSEISLSAIAIIVFIFILLEILYNNAAILLADAIFNKNDHTSFELLKLAVRKLPQILLLVSLALAFGIAVYLIVLFSYGFMFAIISFILVLYLLGRLITVVPTCVLEDVSAFASIKLGFAQTSGKGWKCFGYSLICAVFLFLINSAFNHIFALVSSWPGVVSILLFVILYLINMTFSVSYSILGYCIYQVLKPASLPAADEQLPA